MDFALRLPLFSDCCQSDLSTIFQQFCTNLPRFSLLLEKKSHSVLPVLANFSLLLSPVLGRGSPISLPILSEKPLLALSVSSRFLCQKYPRICPFLPRFLSFSVLCDFAHFWRCFTLHAPQPQPLSKVRRKGYKIHIDHIFVVFYTPMLNNCKVLKNTPINPFV